MYPARDLYRLSYVFLFTLGIIYGLLLEMYKVTFFPPMLLDIVSMRVSSFFLFHRFLRNGFCHETRVALYPNIYSRDWVA